VPGESTASTETTQEIASTDIQSLIDDHQSLIKEYEAAFEKFPGSLSLTMPFHTVYRPVGYDVPTYPQQLAIDWRSQLGIVMERLRDFYGSQHEEKELERYALAGYDRVPNFGHGYASDYILRVLHRHIALLSQKQPRVSLSEVSGPEKRQHERGHPIPADLPRQLEEAKKARRHSWNKAAEVMKLDIKTIRKVRSGDGFVDFPVLEAVRQYIAETPSKANLTL
jgi:hypothetical protein